MATKASKPIKCVAVGDPVVGKTCMLISFTSNKFPNDYFPRLDHFSADTVVEGATVNLGLHDTQGQEDFYRVRKLSYRKCDVFVVVFSLVRRVTYENVQNKWIPELRQYLPGVPVVLVGAKLDLREDKDYLDDNPGLVPVSTSEGEQLREQIGAAYYVECSSKTHHNVKVVFDCAIDVVLKRRQEAKDKKPKPDWKMSFFGWGSK